MRLILDGRFIMHEYNSGFGDKPIAGLAICGYSPGLQKFQRAWLDSFHNESATMFSQGNKGARAINIWGGYAYITPETEQHWGWHTTIEMINDDELVITTFNISPEGEETKATETVYRKVE